MGAWDLGKERVENDENHDRWLRHVVFAFGDDGAIGLFDYPLYLRVSLSWERLDDGVSPLTLGEKVILHGWGPDHEVGSIEDRNETCKRVGHSDSVHNEVSICTHQ